MPTLAVYAAQWTHHDVPGSVLNFDLLSHMFGGFPAPYIKALSYTESRLALI